MTAQGGMRASDCAAHPGQPCDFASLGDFPDGSGKVARPYVLRCRGCGHCVTMPPVADVSFLYVDRDTQDYQPDAKGICAAIKDIAFRRQARKLLGQLPATPRSVLDFGCGSGQFTRLLADLLPRAEVFASDFHSVCPPSLEGRRYMPLTELHEQKGTYDLVLAIHVLEHDDDADGLLSRIIAMARPDGTVVIEVPNVDCIWSRLLGKKWDAWYVPFHRNHFTRASLRHLLARHQLRVLAIHDATVPTMGRTLANMFGAKNNLFWLLAGISLHPIQWLGEKLSGRPSALRAIVQI